MGNEQKKSYADMTDQELLGEISLNNENNKKMTKDFNDYSLKLSPRSLLVLKAIMSRKAFTAIRQSLLDHKLYEELHPDENTGMIANRWRE